MIFLGNDFRFFYNVVALEIAPSNCLSLDDCLFSNLPLVICAITHLKNTLLKISYHLLVKKIGIETLVLVKLNSFVKDLFLNEAKLHKSGKGFPHEIKMTWWVYFCFP